MIQFSPKNCMADSKEFNFLMTKKCQDRRQQVLDYSVNYLNINKFRSLMVPSLPLDCEFGNS